MIGIFQISTKSIFYIRNKTHKSLACVIVNISINISKVSKKHKNDFFVLIYTYRKRKVFVKMLKSFKYRIFPNQEQKDMMSNIFGQVRFVYNLGLETKISAYIGNKKNYTCIDLANQVKELKDTDATWLKESPSQALQMSLRNLDNAYTNFFRGGGFPKFKNKHGKQSFQLPQGVYLENDKQIFIPKLKLVDIDLHRKFKGEIKTVTVSKSVTDKYYVSILVDTSELKPDKKLIMVKTTVGLDLGIKDFCITSDGEKFENKDFFKSTMSKLRIEQRSLSRKKKGSNHYQKQKMVVALIHEKVRNQRQDYLHKISKYLVDNYDTICVEDLAVSNMVKSRKLSRSISDMGWSEFKSMLEYKCDWYGKNLSIIGRFEPSSKTCSSCGSINKDLTLNDREWTCPKCNKKHDRDINAAINIKKIGLRNQPGVTQSEWIHCACGVETHKSLVCV
jgi:putative transposase